jgi:hypothetical protein
VDQQTSPPAGQQRGWPVPNYRRGVEDKGGGQMQWQKLWHFNDKCDGYPTRNFATRKDRPSDDDLCSKCERASFV